MVIIGGGAGGLELTARLCSKFNNKNIEITLIDKQLKHIWKPLLHQVASGTYLSGFDEIDYITYAWQKKFRFVLGSIKNIDRTNKHIIISQFTEDKDQIQLPERIIDYDVLVIAIGSQINDFHIPGVKEHCLLLDSLNEAEQFNRILIKNIVMRTQTFSKKDPIIITIVGGGATGVELAAELQHVLNETNKYVYDLKNRYSFQLKIVEAEKHILSTMPRRISNIVTDYLTKNAILVLENTKINAVEMSGLKTTDGLFIESNIIVWAAGIKANTLFEGHDLETNKINQLVVNSHLQTTKDSNIFAFGDCACCQQTDKRGNVYFVPPRAQAAYQEARLLANSIQAYLNNKPLPVYHYKDYGSLISLSRFNVIGNLMSKIAKNFYIEGVLARITYWLLHKRHMMVIKGIKYVILSTISGLLMKKQKSEIKLH